MTYTFPTIATTFPASALRREMDRLFDDVFTRAGNGSSAQQPSASWQPAASAVEDADGFTLQLDLPGVAPETVEVLAEEGVLSIKGRRPALAPGKDERVLFAEGTAGQFLRRFRLPKTADLQAVSASYALGVLSVRVGKIAPAQPRRVPVAVQAPTVAPATAGTPIAPAEPTPESAAS